MDPASVPEISPHDATLIDWFLSLQPSERLAQLESRLAFINSVRPNADAQLPLELLKPNLPNRDP